MIIKQNLSNNIICNWNIQKINDSTNNYNIISCCFFKRKNLFKDFNIYVNGLKYIIDNYKNIFPTFKLRIYYDNSVNNIINNLELSKDIELYNYDIDIFKDDEDKLYHKDTIGTIIRFLPLFDLDYHKVDKCIIIDIDTKYNNHFKRIIKYIIFNNTIHIAYRYISCYVCVDRIACTKNKYPITANFIFNQYTYHINY